MSALYEVHLSGPHHCEAVGANPKQWEGNSLERSSHRVCVRRVDWRDKDFSGFFEGQDSIVGYVDAEFPEESLNPCMTGPGVRPSSSLKKDNKLAFGLF